MFKFFLFNFSYFKLELNKLNVMLKVYGFLSKKKILCDMRAMGCNLGHTKACNKYDQKLIVLE